MCLTQLTQDKSEHTLREEGLEYGADGPCWNEQGRVKIEDQNKLAEVLELE